jgi:hypothetical protein
VSRQRFNDNAAGGTGWLWEIVAAAVICIGLMKRATTTTKTKFVDLEINIAVNVYIVSDSLIAPSEKAGVYPVKSIAEPEYLFKK